MRSRAARVGAFYIMILMAVGFASGLALVACGDDETGGARCVPGKVEACPCAGGGSGVQACAPDGTFGACECGPGADASGEVGPDASDSSVARDTTHEEIPVFVSDAVGEVSPSDHCEPCGYGSVAGLACSPSQHIGVPNAAVTITAIDCDGTPRTYLTHTGADGRYEFPEIPCGTHAVRVEAGSFERAYQVQVVADQLTDISGADQKVCFAGAATPIAVFWGQWDEQEDLLTELGFVFKFYNFEADYFADRPAEEIEAVQVLRDPAQLDDYRILFFDCGSAALKWVQQFPEIGTNLRNFVLGGGSIYASDLAWAYVEAAFPDAIDFFGKDDLPGSPMASDGPQRVQGQQDYGATVDDAVLAQYLGTGVFTTRYGAGPLIAVAAAGSGTTVHVRGIVHVELPSPPVCGDHICDSAEVLQCADCTGLIPDEFVQHAGPMVLSHDPGFGGKVVYTTFHNDEQADELMKKLLYYLVFQL